MNEPYRTFDDDTIKGLLQKGINPKSPRARYNVLYVTELKRSDAPPRFLLRVYEIANQQLYYKHKNLYVGDQDFVTAVRELATTYRVHQDNFSYEVEDE